ncbi:MAG: hypothetical protein M3N12_01425 [Verrucomicrobiota bacterium]|nr:hypothetical protein [Verrucomicrobiota bacterium]
MVHAESAGARGTEGLLEILGWDLVEFAYDSSVRAPETISMPWDEALIQAVIRHNEGKSPEAEIPSFEEPIATEAPPPKRRGFFSALRKS